MTSQSDEAERRERFRLVYEENYAPILGYALRRTRADEAQDVVAETFLVAWRRLDDVPAHEARLWLYGTARRVLANRARAERRRGRLASRLREHSVDVHVDVHAGGAVAAAFARLRPDERELLSLVAWEGLKTEEIACVLGCSANAVRIRLHRARRKLARELEEDGALSGTQLPSPGRAA